MNNEARNLRLSILLFFRPSARGERASARSRASAPDHTRTRISTPTPVGRRSSTRARARVRGALYYIRDARVSATARARVGGSYVSKTKLARLASKKERKRERERGSSLGARLMHRYRKRRGTRDKKKWQRNLPYGCVCVCACASRRVASRRRRPTSREYLRRGDTSAPRPARLAVLSRRGGCRLISFPSLFSPLARRTAARSSGRSRRRSKIHTTPGMSCWDGENRSRNFLGKPPDRRRREEEGPRTAWEDVSATPRSLPPPRPPPTLRISMTHK